MFWYACAGSCAWQTKERKRPQVSQVQGTIWEYIIHVLECLITRLKVGYLHVIEDDDFELPNYKKIDNEAANDDPNNPRPKGKYTPEHYNSLWSVLDYENHELNFFFSTHGMPWPPRRKEIRALSFHCLLETNWLEWYLDRVKLINVNKSILNYALVPWITTIGIQPNNRGMSTVWRQDGWNNPLLQTSAWLHLLKLTWYSCVSCQ